MNTDLLRKHRYSILELLMGVNADIHRIDGGKNRILYVTPHLSTGGMPQYLLKKIETFNEVADIYCILWEDNAQMYDVQRKQIAEILGDKLIILGENKKELISYIENTICPDIVHFEDLTERFVPLDMMEFIYRKNRPYFICETPHSSTIEPTDKVYLPDRFIMVNKWMQEKYSILECQSDILEYHLDPVEEYNQREYQDRLGLDPDKKHIINVGLFTPGKNQAEVIEYAKAMKDYPVEFHFIGNMAGNFINYWKPIIADLPDNCRTWGESHNVSDFYKAADAFLFTSNWELAPIVIRESIAHRLPIFIKQLPSYSDSYAGEQYVKSLVPKELPNYMEMNIEKLKEAIKL